MFEGSWETNTESDVRKWLFSQGYFPLKIFRKRQLIHSLFLLVDQMNKKSDRIRIWSGLTRRLSLLLEAGIPLLQAVEILANQEEGSFFRPIEWELVKEQLESGYEFSEAIETLVPKPTPYIRAMIRAGEQAGRLSEVLVRISNELEMELGYHRKLVGAYSYPTFLLLLTLTVIYALNIFVLPVYERIFINLEADLPIMTRVIFSLSGLLPQGILFLLFMGMSLLLILRLRYPKEWKEILNEGISHIPFLGKIYRLNDYVQFSRNLGTLLESGIPLLEALNMTRDTVRLSSMKSLIEQLSAAVKEGRRLAPLLRHIKVFPLEASQMLAVGEESGHLSQMLLHMAKIYQLDLENQMDKLPRVLGPLLIVFLSGIIGLVAIGVLLPIFEVGTHLQ